MAWEFAKSSKKCQDCQKNFESEEIYFSALFVLVDKKKDTENFVRHDYCPPCWERKIAPVETPVPVSQPVSTETTQPDIQSDTATQTEPPAPAQPTEASSSQAVEETAPPAEQNQAAPEPVTDQATEPAKQPEQHFSFWQTQMAVKNKPKTPREVLISFFDNLINSAPGPETTEAQPAAADLSAEALAKEETDPPVQQTEETSPSDEEKNKASITAKLRPKVIYLFSLILLRKKILKLTGQKTKDGQDFLLMEKVGSQKKYEIADLKIEEEELITLREEFANLFEFDL